MQVKTVQNIFFFLLLGVTTLAFGALVFDFLMPIFWAAVLAIIFRPAHRFWLRKVKQRPTVAALLAVLTVVATVIVPLLFVGLAVASESAALYERISSGDIDLREPIRQAERALPALGHLADRLGVDLEGLKRGVSTAAITVSRYLATRAFDIGQNAVRVLVLFLLMLYVLFFLFRDGERLIETIVRVLPLGDVRERQLLSKFAEVSRATIKGSLVVGLVQGVIGGLLFWTLGITAPFFWGVIMTLLSILPAVGASLVWLPVAVVLIVGGSVAKGIVLIVVGALVIGLADNVLRPLLVGRDTRMPDYMILLSTLGGLMVFGLSGFVIGPILAAFFMVIWQMVGEQYGEDESSPPALEPES